MTVRLAANVSWLYTELAPMERLGAAADAGFGAVELLFPEAPVPTELARRIADADLQLVLFNAPAGNWVRGERGLASLPGRREEFDASVRTAIDQASVLQCPRVHVMAGRGALDDPEVFDRYVARLRSAAAMAAEDGVAVVIEPINHLDMPGYALRTLDQALLAISAIDHPNVRLQLDLYHHVVEGGDAVDAIRRGGDLIEHVQVAGVPGRHEPDDGALGLTAALAALEAVGFGGWVGCEYRPRTTTAAGLGWAMPYLSEPGSAGVHA